MKKIWILIVLICLKTALSAELFNDEVDDKTDFTVDNKLFEVDYSQSNEKLLFKMEGTGRILALGECSVLENVKMCFLAVDYPSVSVSIESLEPLITIERTLSNEKPLQREKIDFEVTLENTGPVGATNVVYTDEFPEWFVVYNKNLEGYGNGVRWKGKLNSGETETLRYSVEPLEYKKYTSIAHLSYLFEKKESKVDSEEITVDVQQPFQITSSLSSKSPGRNEVITYNMTIKNNDEKNYLNIKNLDIKIPQFLDIVEKTEIIEGTSNTLNYKGRISKGKDMFFYVKVKSNKVGQHTIKSNIILNIYDLDFEEEVTDTLGIGVSEIYAAMDVPTEVDSGSYFEINVSLENTGANQINGISLKIESDLFNTVEIVGEAVEAATTKKILTKKIMAKNVNKSETFPLILTGTYKNGTVYTFKESAEITVNPVEKAMDIIDEVIRNQNNFTVNIYVQNLKNVAVENVDVIEIMPSGLTPIGDITNKFNIGPNEKKKVYSYTITAPSDTKIIKTILNAKINGKLFKLEEDHVIDIAEAETMVQIEGPQESLEQIQEPAQTLKQTEDSPLEQEHNIFKKIINFFKRLFTRSQPEEPE